MYTLIFLLFTFILSLIKTIPVSILDFYEDDNCSKHSFGGLIYNIGKCHKFYTQFLQENFVFLSNYISFNGTTTILYLDNFQPNCGEANIIFILKLNICYTKNWTITGSNYRSIKFTIFDDKKMSSHNNGRNFGVDFRHYYGNYNNNKKTNNYD